VLEVDQLADPEPQPELSESIGTYHKNAEKYADLGIRLDAYESTGPLTSPPSSALSSFKRKAEEPTSQEELNDLKRRKLRDDAQGDAPRNLRYYLKTRSTPT